jgi:hypothetical protein
MTARTGVLTIAGGALALVIAVFVGWLLASCSAARATSNRFVGAVREGRLEDARSIAGPTIEPLLAAGKLSPALLALQSSKGELGVQQSGFGGTFEPFSCFAGDIDDERRYFVVARRLPSGWRVTEVSEVMPESCEGE